MKRRIPLIIALALALCACAACTQQASSSAASSSSPASSATSSGSSSSQVSAEKSIVHFDAVEGANRLADDMANGTMPSSCTVLYDQMGTRPAVTVEDPATIDDIYQRLAAVMVTGTSQESITDSYHQVAFVLQDGTTVRFSFEGEDLLSVGTQNYAVTGTAPLWSLVRSIQDNQK